jgi:DNA modification methylase
MLNTILCGRAEAVLKEMPERYVDLTVTSPPYDNLRKYHGYVFDFEAIAKELYRVTKPGGVLVWVSGDATINGSETGTSFKQALFFKEIGFLLYDTMIYEKPGSGLPHKDKRYGQQFEYMFVLSKGIPKTANIERFPETGKQGITTRRNKDGTTTKGTYNIGGGVKGNIWRMTGAHSKHPAPFPEELAERHIKTWSNPGDIVLDPMAGSGTTLKMALKNGRNYIGIEVSKAYIDEIIIPRLASEATALVAVE